MNNAAASSTIESRIFALLSYFDILDYPLTTAEISHWLHSIPPSSSLNTIEDVLETSIPCKNLLAFQNGFWCLAGRESIIQMRRQRYTSTEQKYQFLRPFLWLMKHFPYIQGIFVTNTLSYDNAKEESDIDLFLVCSRDKIWTVRFWCLTFLTLLRRRPSPSRPKRNMICTNFLVSESKLNLESIILKDASHVPKDIHLAHLLASLIPLYDPKNNMPRLLRENHWVGTFFRWPTAVPSLVGRGRTPCSLSLLGKCVKNLLEQLCAPQCMERLFKRYQLSILPKQLREGAQKLDTHVVISDTLLKFHVNDSRDAIWTKWQVRLKE